MDIFADFQRRTATILGGLIERGALPAGLDLGRFVVEPPRDAAHGDLAINAAMVYAKEAKAHYGNPATFAVAVSAILASDPDVDSAEVAGPGFINVVLRSDVYADVLRAALTGGVAFGGGQTAMRADGRPSTSNMSRPTRPGLCMSGTAAAPCSAMPWPTS